jgi:hypothetical protein
MSIPNSSLRISNYYLVGTGTNFGWRPFIVPAASRCGLPGRHDKKPYAIVDYVPPQSGTKNLASQSRDTISRFCSALISSQDFFTIRVSFETSSESKQPKLEAKLVSALSETKRLFRLFRFCTETESFDVSIEPKQTENQPKQFKRVYTR